MISKSIVIFYSITENGIKLLLGRHSVYKDLMFIGGGKKRNESNSLCASREVFEETRKLMGPVEYIHNIIENKVFKCRPVKINRTIGNRIINMNIHMYFTRIHYIPHLDNLFQKSDIDINDLAYNELCEMVWVDLEKLKNVCLFEEDSDLLKQIEKESDLTKLIKINQSKQIETVNFNSAFI